MNILLVSFTETKFGLNCWWQPGKEAIHWKWSTMAMTGFWRSSQSR